MIYLIVEHTLINQLQWLVFTIMQVTVPCHILQCQTDIVVPVEVAEYLRCHLGGWASVEILQAHGHFPHMSTPELFVPVLLRCLQG